MKIFFKLLYHQFAWTYDWVAAIVSLGRWHDWIFTIIPDIQGSPILELGYGSGLLQSDLLGRWKMVCGLDASRQMGKLTSRRLRRLGFRPQILNGIAQKLPFQGNYFQFVIATFPTEYITDPDTLTETYRILVPGGQLMILPVAWITGKRWFDRFASWLFRITKQAPELPMLDSSSYATDPYDPPQWGKFLIERMQRAGFTTNYHYKYLTSSTLLVINGIKPDPMAIRR